MTGARSNGMPEAYLYLEDGPDVFRVHLHLNRYLIGSGPENDVRIRDPRVGKRHCAISYANGVFSVSARKRAVRVNGRLVAGTQRLDHGTQLDLEGNLITFVQVPRFSTVALQLGLKTGNAPPWFMVLSRPHIQLGSAACDVRIDDDTLAPVQTEIENYGPNLIFIRATSDDHRTTLNEQPLTARRRLRDGDRLRAGRTECVVRLLNRSLPRIDEPLEWRPSRGPISPPQAEEHASFDDDYRRASPASNTGSVTETTMDPEEVADLAGKVAEIDMRPYLTGDQARPLTQLEPLTATLEPDEQAALSTMLVNADELDKVRAELARDRAAKQSVHSPPADGVGDETLHDLATQTNIPISAILRRAPKDPAKADESQQGRQRALTEPAPLAFPKSNIPPPPRPPSRPARRRPSSGAGVVDPGAAKTMAIPVQDIPKPRKPAREVEPEPELATPNRGRPVEQPYYLANTDRPRDSKDPDGVPDTVKPASGAYYLPGRGPETAAPKKARDDKGGTLTDIPAVGVGDDEDHGVYYLPEDQRAHEVRRKSGADYYEVAEEKREAARASLRQELGRSKSRSDAASVPNHLLENAPIDRDFDE